jgi:hypothetical protein
MYWQDKVDGWLPLYIDDVRGRDRVAQDSPQPTRDDRDPGRHHKTADRWLGLLVGWCDRAEYHQSLLAALNARNAAFWQRR